MYWTDGSRWVGEVEQMRGRWLSPGHMDPLPACLPRLPPGQTPTPTVKSRPDESVAAAAAGAGTHPSQQLAATPARGSRCSANRIVQRPSTVPSLPWILLARGPRQRSPHAAAPAHGGWRAGSLGGSRPIHVVECYSLLAGAGLPDVKPQTRLVTFQATRPGDPAAAR